MTLLTGQTVTVVERGSEKTYRVSGAADETMHRVRTPRGTYVFPSGVDFDRFDPELFNVDRLVRDNRTDDATGTVPVIVTERRGTTDAQSSGLSVAFEREVAGTAGVTANDRLSSIHGVSVAVGKQRAAAAYDALRQNPDVAYVHYDRRVHLTLEDVEGTVEADTARAGFDVSGEGVTVAVLDTGIDDSHPDLAGAVVLERDFTGEGTVDDTHGHGTHVAGIIAGDGSASDGAYVGMAPNASLMNLRVIGSDGTGSTSDIIDAVEYADANGADIVSMSLGGEPTTNDPFFDAVQTVTANGTVVVAAAGNSGPDHETIRSPGVVPSAITVGATTDSDDVASFSSRGPTPLRYYVKPDVVAPGRYVYSAEAGTDGYVAKSGTSMSTPVVAGVGALVLEAHPGWTPTRLESAIVTTSDDIGNGDVYAVGGGRLNATAAVGATLVVENATTNLGNVSGDVPATRTVTVTNVGDTSRTVDVSAAATSLDGDTGNVSVNVTTATIGPGETLHVGLTATGDTPNGHYAGRLQLADSEYTAIFGYGVDGSSTLTVEKHAVDATDVDTDAVTLVSHDTGTTDIASLSATDSSGDTATADFAVGDGTYTIYTTGVDESTGQPVLMSQTVSVSGDTVVSFDESNTVAYGLDADDAESADGELATLELVGRLGASVGGSDVHVQVDRDFPGTSTVRFATTTEQTASVAHLLAPDDRYPNGDRHLDTPVLYHLLHSTSGVSGERTFVVDRSSLARHDVTYYRSSDAQTYDVARHVTNDAIAGHVSTGEWSLRDRLEQMVYVTPSDRDGTSSRSAVFAADDSWSYTGSEWLAVDGGTTRTVGINEPPLTQTGYTTVGRFDSSPNVTFLAYPRVEQGATRDVRSSSATISYDVRRDGVVRVSDTTSQDYVYYTNDDPLPDGTTLSLVTAVDNTGQSLSTRTRSELKVAYAEGTDNTPPAVERVDARGLAANGTLDATSAVIDLDVDDNQLSGVSVRVRVADGSVTSSPYQGDVTNTSDDWTAVPVDTVNESDGTYSATVDTTPFEGGTMNLEIAVLDADGNAISTAAYDAYHVESTGDADEPPTAAFTANATTVGLDDTVAFDAADSTDDDGIASYDWAFDDGETATGETTTHAYATTGTYTVTLTVTDTAGQTDTTSETITVEDQTDPSAALAVNESTVPVGGTVEFDATGSTDNVGITEYRWDVDGDGEVEHTTADARTTHSYEAPGTYDATVSVVDDAGNEDTATVTVTVADETAPTAVIYANATTVDVDQPIRFDGANSSDNVGVTGYEWDFGDGTATTGETVSHSYASTGKYTVTLTVRDAAGNTDSTTSTITVESTADDDGGSGDGGGSDGGDDSDDETDSDGSDGDDETDSDGSDGGDDSGGDGGTDGGSSGSDSGSTVDDDTDSSTADGTDQNTTDDSTNTSVRTVRTASETRVVLQESTGPGGVFVPLTDSTPGSAVSIDALTVSATNQTGPFELAVSKTAETPPADTPALDDATAFRYLSIDTSNLSRNASLRVDVRFHLARDALPVGAEPSSVTLHHYDGTSWEALPTTYDAANDSYVATATDFSPFAIGVTTDRADQLETGTVSIGEARVTPSDLRVGQPATIDVELWNPGETGVERTLALTIDGDRVGNRTVRLDPGETHVLTLSHTFEEPGTYTVQVDGTAVASLAVEPDEKSGTDDRDDDGVTPPPPAPISPLWLGVGGVGALLAAALLLGRRGFGSGSSGDRNDGPSNPESRGAESVDGFEWTDVE